MKNKISYLGFMILICAFLSACAHRTENFYFGNYSEAEAAYNHKEYEKAIQKYQAYIDENPEGNLAVISNYYIAKSDLALGRSDEAKKIFQSIIEKHPDLIWANFSETQLKEMEKTPPSSQSPKPEVAAAAETSAKKSSSPRKHKRFIIF